MTADDPPHGQMVAAFQALFGAHPAHMVLLDTTGRILAVNRSWQRFADENGIAPGYDFVGVSYVDVCQRAAEEAHPYALDALTGLLSVLATARPRFTLTYPCHAPNEKRWFRMWMATQQHELPAVIVAHTHLGSERPVCEINPDALPDADRSPTGMMDAGAVSLAASPAGIIRA